ncbi:MULTISPECIES: DUF4209 domain-containing protein [Acidithiobacillus]|jgi:lysyl-tRNA synthetase class 1|uniref:DUF4209 domain-containing protein n=1 Tax=Acidithiobacillus TaxID=119977 RepID=UPI001C07949F|nr:DUF4209 domain-containing protein [Acidithiobacillus ferrooxidans]MBU2808893.1 DUF4209 domain-containing protein [Acidithiobacillus ferrooxidans F221]
MLPIPQTLLEIINRFDAAENPFTPLDVYTALSRGRIAKDISSYMLDERLGMEAELIAFGTIHGFMNKRDPWGSFYRPMVTLADQTGKELYYPDVRQANSDFHAHWVGRADVVTNPILKARYADIAWDLGKLAGATRKDVRMARTAISAYLDVLCLGLVEQNQDSFDVAKRAVDLSVQIKDDTLLNQSRQALLGLHDRLKEATPGVWWARAYDHLIANKGAKISDTERMRLVDDLENVFGRCSDSDNAETFNPFDVQGAGKRLIAHYTRVNRPNEVKRVWTVIAQAMEHNASIQSGAMLAAHFFQDSVEAYAQAGLREDAERIRIRLQGKIRESIGEMKRIVTPIVITQEDAEAMFSKVVVPDPAETFNNIAAAFLLKKNDIEKQASDMLSAAPLASRIPNTIFAQDHVAGRVGSVEEDLHGRTVMMANIAFTALTPQLAMVMTKAIEQHGFIPEHFAAWINRFGVFGEDHLGLLIVGLQAWFDNDYIKALHVLIPQIEYALRVIVDKAGKPTTKPHGPDSGVSVTINMSDILFNEVISDLWPFGADLRFYLTTLYIDPRGKNLRNRIAHGLLRYDEIQLADLLWVVHTLILFGALPSFDSPTVVTD